MATYNSPIRTGAETRITSRGGTTHHHHDLYAIALELCGFGPDLGVDRVIGTVVV